MKHARGSGEDWATNARRPRAMVSDFEELNAQLDGYLAFMATSTDSYVPKNYKEAMECPDLWRGPMEEEMAVMERMGVFKLVPRPKDQHVVGSKWVYDNKYDADGNIKRRKARLVAQGFTQIPGLEFDKTYAAVPRLESMRMIIAIAAHLWLHLWQIDYVSAYLNSDNRFLVYMEQPPGFVKVGEENSVNLVLKTIYGTMNGAYEWAKHLGRSYKALGYYESKADPCVRHRVDDNGFTLTGTHTDDVLGVSSTHTGADIAIEELGNCYEIKDLGEPTYILGIRIDRDEPTGTISISQRVYLEQVLKQFGMQDCNPKSTPLPSGIDLSSLNSPQTEDDRAFMKDKPYNEALGSIMWAQGATRPDLSFAVNLLSRFQANPGRAHWNAILHVFAYIKGTLDYQITYHRGTDGGLKPYGYVDSDYAGDTDTRRSTSGFVFMMAGGAVSWSSKRQPTVSLSTTEAEYMALTRAAQQAIWMFSFMSEIGLPQEMPATLYGDNMSSIALTLNHKGHSRAKHIDVHHHFIRERVEEGDIEVVHISSAENLADILTKPLPRIIHQRISRKIFLDG